MARKGNSTTPEHVKLFIVRQLAAYDPPSEVVKAVRAEFGIDIKPQVIEGYNPERKAGGRLSEKLRVEFYRARLAFEEDLDGIPEAKRAVRIRMLARAARRAEHRGNDVLMADHLERIAKETGGAYEGRRKVELTGADGTPLQHEHHHSWDADSAVKEALGALEE